MKHCILAKFKKEISAEEKEAMLPEIRALFDNTLALAGVHEVVLRKNCTPRDNRYDLMIELDMEPEALSAYDSCPWHKQWKAEYCPLLEAKAIFDYEV